MTMSRCFSKVFDEPMKERGFKRKGILYYRLNGEILQGITMKTVNPYIISFNFHPWWMHDLKKEFWETEKYIKTNVWAEAFDKWGFYFCSSEEEEALEDMETMLDWVIESAIPALDRVSTVDDYIRIMMENIELDSPVPEIRGYDSRVNQYALLYKAWRDQSFENTHRIFDELIERDIANSKKCNPLSSDENLYNYLMRRYSVLVSKMEENDYSSFEAIYEEECAKMRELLQTHLKLTV